MSWRCLCSERLSELPNVTQQSWEIRLVDLVLKSGPSKQHAAATRWSLFLCALLLTICFMWEDVLFGPTRPPWLSESLVPIGLCRVEAPGSHLVPILLTLHSAHLPLTSKKEGGS